MGKGRRRVSGNSSSRKEEVERKRETEIKRLAEKQKERKRKKETGGGRVHLLKGHITMCIGGALGAATEDGSC